MTTRLLARVSSTLTHLDIPHALIGAAALAVHGISRSTLDQDLLVCDLRVLERSVWSRLDDAAIDIRRGEADDPLAGVVRITAAQERDVDVVVGRHAWQREALARASRLRTGDLDIPVVSVADLILLKLYAGGDQDMWDVAQLLAANDSPVVRQEVGARLPRLPARCAPLWARVSGG